MQWISDNVFWTGLAGLVTAFGGAAAAIYQLTRQKEPPTDLADVPEAIEDIRSDLRHIEHKVDSLIDIGNSNSRALSKLEGFANAAFLRGR